LLFLFHKASEILLFNRKLNAQEAFERNLVNEIIPHSQFTKLAWEKIEKISELSPKVIGQIFCLKECLNFDSHFSLNLKLKSHWWLQNF
jgi:1,4-dihydroxy-2-naphthoyl-CoA synthase